MINDNILIAKISHLWSFRVHYPTKIGICMLPWYSSNLLSLHLLCFLYLSGCGYVHRTAPVWCCSRVYAFQGPGGHEKSHGSTGRLGKNDQWLWSCLVNLTILWDDSFYQSSVFFFWHSSPFVPLLFLILSLLLNVLLLLLFHFSEMYLAAGDYNKAIGIMGENGWTQRWVVKSVYKFVCSWWCDDAQCKTGGCKQWTE